MPPSLCDLALVDAHAHLYAPQFADYLDEVVARAAHRGGEARIVCWAAPRSGGFKSH